MISVSCEWCKKDFTIVPSRLKNSSHSCSVVCRGKLNSKLYSRKVKVECVICHKDIYYKKSHIKNIAYPTCSRVCGAKSKSIRNRGGSNPKSLNLSKSDRFFWDRAKGLAYRAQSRNLDIDVDYKFLASLFEKQEKKCYYSGIEMSLGGGRKYNSLSVDRIDSKKGYTNGNIVLCLYCVNMFKAHYDLEDIKKVMKGFSNYVQK